MKKINTKGLTFSWLQIILGCLLVAVGFVMFINPYKMVPGGVYGTSIILHNLWDELQVGTYSYFLQIPLMLLSTVLLGKKLGVRTLFVVLFTPFVMNALTLAVYPDAEAVQTLDATKLLNGTFNLSGHLILASIYGGLCVGIGSGLIVRNQTGTGGTDLVGMMVQKYMGIRFSKAILLIDGTIIICGLFITGSVLLSLYSLVAVFALNVGLHFALSGTGNGKIIYIIANSENGKKGDNTLAIHDFIVNELGHTATLIPCRGLYSGEDKQMIMMVVRDKMVPLITHSVTQFEPDCFLVVTNAYQSFGIHWSKFPEKDDLLLG